MFMMQYVSGSSPRRHWWETNIKTPVPSERQGLKGLNGNINTILIRVGPQARIGFLHVYPSFINTAIFQKLERTGKFQALQERTLSHVCHCTLAAAAAAMCVCHRLGGTRPPPILLCTNMFLRPLSAAPSSGPHTWLTIPHVYIRFHTVCRAKYGINMGKSSPNIHHNSSQSYTCMMNS